MFPRTYFPPTYFAPTYFPGPPSNPGALALSGPSAGITGNPSTNFTVTATALPTTDNVTPASDTGGTFTPPAQGFAAGSSSHTFRYTPSADGLHAISIGDTIGATISGSPRGYTSTTPTPTPTPPPGFDLKQAIVAALAASSATVALVGQNVFPVAIPQSVNLAGGAALTYKVVSGLHDSTLTAAAGMRATRVRFRLSSIRHGDTEVGLELVRNLFQGLIGPVSGLPICFVTSENEIDGYDEPIPGSDLGTHWKEFDLIFKLRESIPTNT